MSNLFVCKGVKDSMKRMDMMIDGFTRFNSLTGLYDIEVDPNFILELIQIIHDKGTRFFECPHKSQYDYLQKFDNLITTLYIKLKQSNHSCKYLNDVLEYIFETWDSKSRYTGLMVKTLINYANSKKVLFNLLDTTEEKNLIDIMCHCSYMILNKMGAVYKNTGEDEYKEAFSLINTNGDVIIQSYINFIKIIKKVRYSLDEDIIFKFFWELNQFSLLNIDEKENTIVNLKYSFLFCNFKKIDIQSLKRNNKYLFSIYRHKIEEWDLDENNVIKYGKMINNILKNKLIETKYYNDIIRFHSLLVLIYEDICNRHEKYTKFANAISKFITTVYDEEFIKSNKIQTKIFKGSFKNDGSEPLVIINHFLNERNN